MTTIDVATVALLLFGYSLVSRRLSRWWISTPMFFVIAGLVIATIGRELISDDFVGEGLSLLAEITLVMILFGDATRIDLSKLRGESNIPVRLLAIGLPLTVLLGTLIGWGMFPVLGVGGALLLAVSLAPTDAALGQAVVSDPKTPHRIRQALNVESGLNDGLTAPLVTIAIGIVAITERDDTGAIALIVREVGFGVIVGVLAGWIGGLLLDSCTARRWVDGRMMQLGSVALAVGTYALAVLVEGNGFVAAFVAGVVFGAVAKRASGAPVEFAENEGQLLTILTFLFWAVKVAYPELGNLTPRVLLYVLLSLTIIRMLPVAISLLGLGLKPQSIAYLGWFGPRGLASIIYGFSALQALDTSDGLATMETTITWTVLVSVVLHGVTAVPFAAAYGKWYSARDADAHLEEAVKVPHQPVRGEATQAPPVSADASGFG